MKRPMFLLIAALIVAASAAYGQTKYVAVVETEVDEQSGASAKMNKAEVREVTAVLRNGARNNLPSGKYKIMTAETVIAQGSAKLEECAEENCVIALGSRIGADYIVRGTVNKVGTKLTLSIVMYETEDGTLVASERVSADKAEDLLDKAVAACAGMYRTFASEYGGGQKGAAQPTATTQTAPLPPPPPPAPPQPVAAAPQPTYQPPAPIYQQQATLDGSGALTDGRDGKRYKTVVIGGKRWMGENLNYQPQTGKSWCYDNDNSNCGKYGRLYDWNTARTVCPGGWHLPSRQEWNDLEKAAGSNEAGKRLKAKGGWSGNGNGTDAYGFSALPGGYRNSGGTFSRAGSLGYWWTATEDSGELAYYRYIYYYYDGVNETNYYKSNGFAVRCVSD